MNDRRPGELSAVPETVFLDTVERLERHAQGRKAVHLHLSGLQSHHRRPHHLRIAAYTFETQVRALEGQIFVLPNEDIVFIARGVALDALVAAAHTVRGLFAEDPLAHVTAPDRRGFCTGFDLDVDYPKFLLHCRTLAGAIRQRTLASADKPEPQPLTLDELAKIDEAIRNADLTNFVRRQSVCAILPGTPATPVFREQFVSIADLARSVAPRIDLASSRWLFQHLTEILDLRMLAFQSRDSAAETAARVSLNLNVRTLLSPEFLAFDGTVRTGTRGTIVLELQLLDVFADAARFFFARDFVRERGYKICIDGIAPPVAGMIDRDLLGADFVKLFWSREMLGRPTGKRFDALRALVRAGGPDRAILCRCESPESLTLGQQLGFTLFQGRHVDSLLAGPAKPA